MLGPGEGGDGSEGREGGGDPEDDGTGPGEAAPRDDEVEKHVESFLRSDGSTVGL